MTPFVDPEVLAAVADYRLPEPNPAALAAVREAPARPVDLSSEVARVDAVVAGDPPIPIRIHRRRGTDGQRPVVLAFHGGGLVFGSHYMDDPLFDSWCQRFGLVGISVGYRLAPEVPFPGPVDDAHRALVWVHENAEALRIDRENIGVYGLSAGGCVAAGLALRARDESSVAIRHLILETPMLDDRPTSSMSREGLLVWTKQWNDFGWRSYLGSQYGSDDVSYHAAPGRAADLSGLPSTYLSVGSADGFLDENVGYALRMNRCGSSCDLHVYAGLTHGYRLAPQAGAVRRAVADMDQWLEQQIS